MYNACPRLRVRWPERLLVATALASVAGPLAAASVDFNRDGRADILWRNADSGDNRVWLMRGATRLQNASLPGVPDTQWTVAGAADFNGDGGTDILWRHAVLGTGYLWIMNGASRTSNLAVPRVADPAWRVVGTADFNADGKADVLWRHSGNGAVALWLMNGASRLSNTALPSVTDLAWSVAGVADFNADDKADVVWRHAVDGRVFLWTMNGATRSGIAVLPPVTNPAWKIVGSADFDGDRKADLLWRNEGDGSIRLWRMNGGVRLSNVELPAVSNLAWSIAGVDDFTGDGKADILWRNSATGENRLWEMNGSIRVANRVLDPVTNPAWRIAAPRGGGQAAQSAIRLGAQTLLPSTIARLPLADLEREAGGGLGGSVSVSVASGSGLRAAIGKNRVLNVLAPLDGGRDRSGSVTLRGSSGRVVELPIMVPSQLPRLIDVASDSTESGAGSTPASITISGLPSGILSESTAASMAINLPSTGPVSLASPSLRVSTSAFGSSPVDVSSLFRVSSNQIRFRGEAISVLPSLLSTGVNLFQFEVADADFDTYAFDLRLFHGKSTVTLAFRDAAGRPIRTANPVLVVLRGAATGITHELRTDGSGSGVLEGVVPDAYHTVVADLSDAIVGIGTIVVPQSGQSVAATLTVSGTGLVGGDAKSALPLDHVAAKSEVLQHEGARTAGDDPRRLDLDARSRPAREKLVECPGPMSGSRARVDSAEENVDIACTTDLRIPRGTQTARIRVDVSTIEYPTFTQQRSPYNDQWRYDVSVPALGRRFADAGRVNDSHYSSASITPVNECVDVRAAAQAADLPVRVSLSAINVEDSLLATTVAVEVTPGCTAGLSVTAFTASSPNARGYTLFKSRTNAPDEDRFLGIPTGGVSPAFGFPAEIRYAPVDATIDSIKFAYITSSGAVVEVPGEYRNSATMASGGIIRFSDLRLAAAPLPRSDNKVAVTVRLGGRRGTAPIATDDSTPVEMRFEGLSKFYPLFESTVSIPSAPRYPVGNTATAREASLGWDGWGRSPLLNWLNAAQIRFNDISPLHAARRITARGERSILDHASHSTGTIVDLRYRNDVGGYDGPLAGANGSNGVIQLANQARQEVASNAASKPNLARLQAWISQNRNLIAEITASAGFRKLLIGDQSFRKIIMGRFPDGTAIPSVPAYTLPTGVISASDHLDHCHAEFAF